MPINPRDQYDAITADLVTAGVTSGQAFGMPSLFLERKMFAGFHHDAMVFKLGGAAHAEALALAGAHLFDPSGSGRPMKAWVEVPRDHIDRWSQLAEAALESIAGRNC